VTRRGATRLAGVLLVDKPAGMTSHDVVAAVRRATGEGRVGHAGTLDPMATGLLVVLVGAYTRLAPYLTGQDKSYEATIAFGTATDTDDAEGAVTSTLPVPDDVADRAYAETTLAGLLGEQLQRPPAYSAIKVGGTTSHRAARAGRAPDLSPRPIDVKAAELLETRTAPPEWDASFVVSKGTYIRAIARDVGERCGTVAHLSALRRLASGSLRVSDATALSDVVARAEIGGVEDLFADPVAALGMPVLALAAASDSAVLLGNGRRLPLGGVELDEGRRCAVVVDGRLAAIYRRESDALAADVVLASGTES
jgi:tRNA pseudouridine55 synthase